MSHLSSQQVSTMVEDLKSALFSANNLHHAAVQPWLKQCNKTLRLFNAQLKKSMTTGEKNHLTASIGLVYGFRQMFKARLSIGGGYQPRKQTASHRVQWVDQQSAFANRMRTGVVVNLKHKDVGSFLDDAFVLLRRRINNALKKEKSLKVNAVFCGEFKVLKSDTEYIEFKYISTKFEAIWSDTNMNDWYNANVKASTLKQLEEFQEKDSGWALSNIINVTFNINKFIPQRGSSYIELPRQIKLKHACINVKNDDDACFAWAVTSALYPATKNADRPSSYPHYSTVLNLDKITMPMTLKQIPRFEAQNQISINVYILQKYKSKNQFSTASVYLTKNKQARHVNLLLTQNVYYNDDEEEDKENSNQIQTRYHYVWIKDLSRLVNSQIARNNGKRYFCDRCMNYFYTSKKLQTHIEDCNSLNECKIRVPTQEKKIVKFKNYKHKEKVPFIIYADIECLLEPIQDKNKYQKHVPCSIGYYVKCSYDDSLSFYKKYSGVDCKEWYAQEMLEFAENVETVFLCTIPMDPMTLEEKFSFRNATSCHICEQSFQSVDKRVRDHCHLTGKYRGPAHEQCNLDYRDSLTIPVVFHNLSGYDSHFIIKNLAKDIEGRVDLLPINKEKYISFTKHIKENLIKFRFIDSYKFMASSLEKLASYLPDYPILKSEFQNLNKDQFNLLTRKGVYPYEYMNSWDKLNETELPDISKFYSQLNDSNITDKAYEHAQNVWKHMNIKNLGEYTDLYLKTDVLLLADIFEQFRNSCVKTYKLDPAHYYTLPGYTWDAMLKFTDINLELLTDIDMILFVERGIRGGLSQCSHRHAKANNKYLPNYDPHNKSMYLMYFDINNQYGVAMSQYLPYGGFEWVDDPENLNIDIPDDSETGYILEVDLKYPQSLHDSHSDLPLCPEHGTPTGSKDKKLLATLYDKNRYIIHYRSLKQAIENGIELVKIHRVLKFNQSPWLKAYIDLNTSLRQASVNEFEKNMFKLMNNAVFGKTMENVRKYSNVKLKTKWEGRYGAEALISSPMFKSSLIFEENLVIIELNKTEIVMNKPIYIGMCILDLAKLTIYDFHYNYMKSRFSDKAKVCYTDTDSLVYQVECSDIYSIIREDAEQYFDTSEFKEQNQFNMPRVNSKVLGKMKDENAGKIMTEFIGLRSKMYACRVEFVDKDKKAKGVKNSIIKNQITFEDYLECLSSNKNNIKTQHCIRSEKHEVSTLTQTKVVLNALDDKRYICSNGINTLAWGHYSIIET